MRVRAEIRAVIQTFRAALRPLGVASVSGLLMFGRAMAQGPRLSVPLVTDEPEAVLAILDRREAGQDPVHEDWERLFRSEGYRRLKQREASLGRAFDDSTFRAFVLSDTLLGRAPALRRTLAEWKRVDPNAAARRAFAYLPPAAVIRAKVYPVIKPRTNSFVFEPRTNPAVFLYLDPNITAAKLENIVAHELHHIGVGSTCPVVPADSTLPTNLATALTWMGGFAEGRAVLAAAGGPAVHPHAASDSAERAVWDRDVANVERDLRRLERFFLEILDGRLADEERTRQGMAFVNTEDVPQGPYYTVGWLMAATVERVLGRARLVTSLCDPRLFLSDYNRAAARHRGAPGAGALWSDALLRRIGAQQPASTQQPEGDDDALLNDIR